MLIANVESVPTRSLAVDVTKFVKGFPAVFLDELLAEQILFDRWVKINHVLIVFCRCDQ